MQISLIGYMGSGKSTIGKRLSQILQIKFLDLDELIESHTQKSISELFSELGEIKFRKIERELLLSILQSEIHFVLAVGGGTPVYYDNIVQMNQHTKSIYLRSNPKYLAERLINEKSARPLITHINDEDLTEFIAKHLFERRSYYEEANYKIDITLKGVDEITDEIIHLLHLQK